MSRSGVRRMLVVFVGSGAILLSANPAAAYNEENVKQVRMERLDEVSCDAPIRLSAALTDSSGAPVAGAEVQFTYKKSAAGDSIGPATAISDAAGLAGTTIELSCVIGSRIIRAFVPGDGSAQIVVTCSPRNGCTIKPQGEVEGIVGGPPADNTLPDTGAGVMTPASLGDTGHDETLRGFGLVLLIGISIGVLWLVGWSPRWKRSRP